MQVIRPAKVQSEINVTPLVDVVLVLLIIFMVVVPQMAGGPDLELPTTEQPPQKPDDGSRLLVSIESNGKIWVDDEQVPAESFLEHMARAAGNDAESKVVIKGDARLSFGTVKRAMLAWESARFEGQAEKDAAA